MAFSDFLSSIMGGGPQPTLNAPIVDRTQPGLVTPVTTNPAMAPNVALTAAFPRPSMVPVSRADQDALMWLGARPAVVAPAARPAPDMTAYLPMGSRPSNLPAPVKALVDAAPKAAPKHQIASLSAPIADKTRQTASLSAPIADRTRQTATLSVPIVDKTHSTAYRAGSAVTDAVSSALGTVFAPAIDDISFLGSQLKAGSGTRNFIAGLTGGEEVTPEMLAARKAALAKAPAAKAATPAKNTAAKGSSPVASAINAAVPTAKDYATAAALAILTNKEGFTMDQLAAATGAMQTATAMTPKPKTLKDIAAGRASDASQQLFDSQVRQALEANDKKAVAEAIQALINQQTAIAGSNPTNAAMAGLYYNPDDN